MKTDISCT